MARNVVTPGDVPVGPGWVEATQWRASLRSEWLHLRIEALLDRTRAPQGDPAPRRARLDELDAHLSSPGFAHGVAEVFGLDAVETLLFECLAAAELPGAACAALLDFGARITGATRQVVVDALVAALSDRTPTDATRYLAALAPAGRLRRAALVDVDDEGVARRLAPVRLGAGMLEHLLGDLPTARGCSWLLHDDPAGEDGVEAAHLALATATLAHPERTLLAIVGPSGSGRSALARAAARSLGRPILRLDCEQLLAATSTELTLARIDRDATLVDAVVLLEGLTVGEAGVASSGGAPAARRATLHGLARIAAPLVVTADGDEPALADVERPIVRVATGLPDEATRVRLWSASLGAAEAATVARMFALSPRVIRHAAVGARVRAAARTGDGAARATVEEARESIRSVVATSGVRALGAESDFRPLIEELVVSPENAELLVELVMRVRMRHRVMDEWGFRAVAGPSVGVAALFHGPPGTGKSMAAHAIATCLGVECFRIDLSQVVSKWVGETEKSLAKVFEMAERSDALLLFDEADALFTKRTEVKSSNDRYANLEVNFLLQRVEAFPGLAILTTNHVAAIDAAFMRRLAVQIRFDFPDVNERQELWRRKLPASAPLAPDVSLARLAERYPMTGARIRNAALRAAFFAADGDLGQGITQEHLERAIHAEYRGAGLTPGKSVNLE